MENVNVVARYLKATNAWDFKTIRELLHDEVVFELPFAPDSFPRRILGKATVMQFLQSVPDFAAEENLHDITINTLSGNPDELIAEYKSDMKLTCGREYRNRYVLRVSIRDGQLIRFAEYFDPIALIKAMGGSVNIPV